MTAAERVLHAATCELLDRDPVPTWEQWQAETGDDEDFGHEDYDLLAAATLDREAGEWAFADGSKLYPTGNLDDPWTADPEDVG